MNTKQAEKIASDNQHAVVIGASMAGLLAGRVLSDHFARVTIIERDRLPDSPEARKGVPQGQHGHVLLNKGVSILKELFPDLFPALVQGGSSRLDSIADIRWYHFERWKANFPSTIELYSQSRPFLEHYVRCALAARANIRFIDGCEVAQLRANGDHTRITGVQLRHPNEKHSEEELIADLVVDASGRGSQAPQWLTSLGYDKVKESSVKVDVGYATRIYRLPGQTSSNWKMLIINPTPPDTKREAICFPSKTATGWCRWRAGCGTIRPTTRQPFSSSPAAYLRPTSMRRSKMRSQ